MEGLLAAYLALYYWSGAGTSPIRTGDAVASLVFCAVGLTCFVSLALGAVIMVERGTMRFPLKDEGIPGENAGI